MTDAIRWAACFGSTAADRRNMRRFLAMELVWGALFIAATHGLKNGWIPDGAASWLAVALVSAAGVAVVATYMRFLREADELVRKIQLESIAVGFGAGFVVIVAYFLLNLAGLGDWQVVDPILPMAIAWAGAQLLFTRRYA